MALRKLIHFKRSFVNSMNCVGQFGGLSRVGTYPRYEVSHGFFDLPFFATVVTVMCLSNCISAIN